MSKQVFLSKASLHSNIQLSMNLDLSQVRVGFPRLLELRSFRTILNATDTVGWLDLHRDDFVGWTYSVTEAAIRMFKPKKLIIGNITTVLPAYYWDRVKLASHCHIKCYIGPDEMLVGSFNLTAPSIEDMMVRVTDKVTVREVRGQFNKHWKALT